ncbi:Ser/Thr protein phosphatase [Tritrichomonas foetus]|uniref:Ser/Thr protein phosphatase n=1 Tax=Tritrichomonas foetus TaxID=1144522 RepID=A0A1J4KAB8_9EUKA|nr:Ser/Thr protein phosphatase [Tritrichomonas foetus]|eukprot:OHT07856.1 Ser/Thr protein phosphatase [Tritrichomonas foetus]
MEPLYSSYETIYRSILTVFSWLPLAVLLNRKCLLIHGGLSPKLKSLDDIKNIRLPISELNDNLVTDILWSDPCSSISSYVSSPRGLGVLFGRTVLKNFLAQNKLKYIIRGHQCVQSGIETPMNGIVTVFSTSYYSDEENLGGYIQFKNITDLKYRTFRLSPFRSISRKMAQFYSVRTGGIRSRTITITMSSSKLPSLYTSKTTASSRNILSDQIKKRRLSTHSPGSIKSTKSSTSKQLSFDL